MRQPGAQQQNPSPQSWRLAAHKVWTGLSPGAISSLGPHRVFLCLNPTPLLLRIPGMSD